MLALCCASNQPAIAQDAAIIALVAEVQSSERLIAAAIEAADLTELDFQMTKALDNSQAMLKISGIERFMPCVSASTALSGIARTAPQGNNAASHLEFSDKLVQFTVDMDICEERLGLEPTRPPNLTRARR